MDFQQDRIDNATAHVRAAIGDLAAAYGQLAMAGVSEHDYRIESAIADLRLLHTKLTTPTPAPTESSEQAAQ